MPYYALMTTLGSIAGCLALYTLARKGGEAFLRRRFKAHTSTRAMERFRSYGLLAILIPSILPPPTPFKIFVLAAGVAKVRPLRLHHGHRDRPRLPLLRRGTAGASTTASRPRTSSARTPALSALALGALALVVGGGWFLWRRRVDRAQG